MRLLIKASYNVTLLTKDLAAEEIGNLCKLLDTVSFIKEEWTGSKHVASIDEEQELEIEVLPTGSKRIPELPLKQHVKEATVGGFEAPDNVTEAF